MNSDVFLSKQKNIDKYAYLQKDCVYNCTKI